MDSIEDVIKDVESWLGVEEKKVVSFLKPIISNVVAAGKADLLSDVETDAPAIATSFATGGAAAALATATADLTTQLAAQGKALEDTTMTALAAAAVASAQTVSPASSTLTA